MQEGIFTTYNVQNRDESRAVDPHSLLADPDPAIVLNSDPGPAFKTL